MCRSSTMATRSNSSRADLRSAAVGPEVHGNGRRAQHPQRDHQDERFGIVAKADADIRSGAMPRGRSSCADCAARVDELWRKTPRVWRDKRWAIRPAARHANKNIG